MKLKLFLVLLPVLLFLLILGGAFFWFQTNLKPVSSAKDLPNQSFVVQKGEAAVTIATNLQKTGLIRNALVFRIYSKLSGKEKSIPPGEYELVKTQSTPQIFDTLLKGPVALWVTIPEGVRHEQIVDIFIKDLQIKEERVEDFKKQFLVLSKDKEGYLFPDTYLFLKDATPIAIINRLIANFDAQTKDLNLTKDDVILASILERETNNSQDEKAMIAGILLNRVNAGWPLQADATVQYVVGTDENWWPTLTQDNLDTSSSFNTYKFAGLPPSPISNPGLSSLQAAASPTDSSYWYYIHDLEGIVHYAETLEEHNTNVAKYLR